MAGLNILVVDDEVQITLSIKMALKKSGHTVDAVYNGAEALTRLTELPNHYQILIVDHHMPEIFGLEFLVRLPMNAFKGKIIVLSAYLTPDLEAKYRALGAERIMQKPFGVLELRKTIEELKPSAVE